ncbi:MAG: hypothetical protein AAGF26_10805 [Cyanobacteria bacterium P01_G01_bin.49]
MSIPTQFYQTTPTFTFFATEPFRVKNGLQEKRSPSEQRLRSLFCCLYCT